MPHLAPRPRTDSQPVVDVDFICSEGERIDRISLGSGLNFFGRAIGVEVADGELRENAGGPRFGVIIFLPAASMGSIREALTQREREMRGSLAEAPPFPTPTSGRRSRHG